MIDNDKNVLKLSESETTQQQPERKKIDMCLMCPMHIPGVKGDEE